MGHFRRPQICVWRGPRPRVHHRQGCCGQQPRGDRPLLAARGQGNRNDARHQEQHARGEGLVSTRLIVRSGRYFIFNLT